MRVFHCDGCGANLTPSNRVAVVFQTVGPKYMDEGMNVDFYDDQTSDEGHLCGTCGAGLYGPLDLVKALTKIEPAPGG